MIGDGQVSQGSTVSKSNAIKIRTLNEGKTIVGMAGMRLFLKSDQKYLFSFHF